MEALYRERLKNQQNGRGSSPGFSSGSSGSALERDASEGGKNGGKLTWAGTGSSITSGIYLFLQTHSDQKSPLLVGYSGGPDSKALLYALLEWGRAPIQVAHIDHGWREKSSLEAKDLQKEVEGLGLIFHSIRLQPPSQGNWEANAREKRLLFFESLFQQTPFQALLLAHHQDDLAETVLKRVFEGAHLPFLGGMEPVGLRGKMPIWRPLLGTRRSEILCFLKKRNLSFIDDPTNRDPSFLRSRMREKMFPFLNETFGKDISTNLSYLGARSHELKDYLGRKTEEHPIFKGPWGISFELPKERIEARYLLQKFISLSRIQLEEILDGKKGSDWEISPELFIDRGWVFILHPNPPRFGEELVLKPGHFRSGDWEIRVEETEEEIQCDWKRVWSGRFSCVAGRGSLLLPSIGCSLKKIWSEKKVPSFLRRQIPVVVEKGVVWEEFLSGKKRKGRSPSFKITLTSSPQNG